MAMDPTRLATKIVNDLAAGNAEITGAAKTALLATWKTICTDIISEITTNAQVTASGPDPDGGVQNVTGTVS